MNTDWQKMRELVAGYRIGITGRSNEEDQISAHFQQEVIIRAGGGAGDLSDKGVINFWAKRGITG